MAEDEARSVHLPQRCVCGRLFADSDSHCRTCGARKFDQVLGRPRLQSQDSAESADKVEFEFEGGQHEGALKALNRHSFFSNLKPSFVDVLAKAARRRSFDPALAGQGGILVPENSSEWQWDHLWVIESGTVEICERGQSLGIIGEGSVFGEVVTLKFLAAHPYTVRLTDSYLVTWSVPNAAVNYALGKYPMVRPQLEERACMQLKQLFLPRLSKTNYFSHCSGGFLTQIHRQMKVAFYNKQEVMFEDGSKMETFLGIVRGSVKIVNQKINPRRVTPMHKSSNLYGLYHQMSHGSGLSSRESGCSYSRKGSGSSSRRASHRGGAFPPTAEEEEVEKKLRFSADGTTSGSANWLRLQNNLGNTPNFTPSQEAETGSESQSLSVRVPGSRDKEGSNSPSKARRGALKLAAEEEEGDEDGNDDDGEESEEESDSNSEDSQDNEDEDTSRYFRLPDTRPCLEPVIGTVEAIAGPEPILFGELAVLGKETVQEQHVTCSVDVIALTLTRDDMDAATARYRKERSRFKLLEDVGWKEWQRCHMLRLGEVDIFSACSPVFLTALAEVAEPVIFYPNQLILDPAQPREGLTMLMSGSAEFDAGDGARQIVEGRYTFGSSDWLGEGSEGRLEARGLCQVLQISHEGLLGCLKLFPEESTAMAQKVLRKQATPSALNPNAVPPPSPLRDRRGGRMSVLQVNIWYLPFCFGLDPLFIEGLAKLLERVRLVNGQSLFRCLKGPDSDFLVVVVAGKIKVLQATAETDTEKIMSLPAAPQEEKSTVVTAPLVICGFDKSRPVAAQSVGTGAEMYRLNTVSCTELGKRFPEEMRTFLERMMAFQVKLENKRNWPWWGATAALQRLDAFSDCSDETLKQLVKVTKTTFYIPGETIVTEGDRVDKTMLLESGTASVERVFSKNTVVVPSVPLDTVHEPQDGHWIGGLGGLCGFATDVKRRATLRALTVCKVHEITISDYTGILSTSPSERHRFRDLVERRLRETDSERLEDHSFFQAFTKTFINMLRPKCLLHVYFAGETVFQQGDVANGLVIFNAGSHIMVSNAKDPQAKELMGKRCFGVVALLSNRTVRHTSTVVTKTACAVRHLTRSDWIDALKLYPEHRRWIGSFTREQLRGAHEQRDIVQRREAWEKIRTREKAASQRQAERLCSGDALRKLCGWTTPPFLLGAMEVLPPMTPSSPRKEKCRDETQRVDSLLKPERWPCFNSNFVTVPSLKLPKLSVEKPRSVPEPQEAENASVSGHSEDSGLAGEEREEDPMPLNSKRVSLDWAACEQALGISQDTE